MRYLILFSLLATLSMAQSSLRLVPEGTRLSNGLVTPIYLDYLRLPAEDDPGNPLDDEDDQMHLRLKDGASHRVNLYVERGKHIDLDGTVTPTLKLYLNRPGGTTGAREIVAASKEEKAYLLSLRVAEEHYTPGWTKNWSIENHHALKKLIADLAARNP
jgi:hypothetical protein